jgi:hypothetical protein
MVLQDFDFDDIRSALERTLLVAQQQGMVSQTEQGWQYAEGFQTISYDPQTGALSLSDTQTGQVLDWKNGELQGNPQLDSEQLAEFQQLEQWLDSQFVPQDIELEDYFSENHLPDVEEATHLMQSAERLFEHYASSGEPAFKTVEGSPIDYYQVDVGNLNYFISRNEDTGQYNLQRHDTDLNLNPVQCVTDQDITAWAEVDRWLDEFAVYADRLTSTPSAHHQADGFVIPAEPVDSAERMTYWETHSAQLAEIEPIAERFLSFQESVGEAGVDLDRHLYGTEIGDYQISYLQETGKVEIYRGANNLAEPGNLNQQDVEFFRSVAVWLDGRDSTTQLGEALSDPFGQVTTYPTDPKQDFDFDR